MATEVDDTAAPDEGHQAKGHGPGGLLHGKHSTEILVICSVVTVVLGYLTFRGKSSGAADTATTSPTGISAGDVAGFDAASVQGLSDQLSTIAQAQAGAFQSFGDAIAAETDAQHQANTGLQTQIANQGQTLSNLTTSISALPQQIASRIPAPIAGPAGPAGPAAPSGGGGTFYTIKSGDTLSGIAARYPSASITASSIAKLNGIANPNKIYAGTTIRIS